MQFGGTADDDIRLQGSAQVSVVMLFGEGFDYRRENVETLSVNGRHCESLSHLGGLIHEYHRSRRMRRDTNNGALHDSHAAGALEEGRACQGRFAQTGGVAAVRVERPFCDPERRLAMPQYLIVGVHPPDLCPSANEKIRNLAAEGGKGMPALGEKLRVKILATYVPMTNHQVFVAVEADDANAVREFAFQGRLGQWNTIEILQTSTLEEALTRVQELETIY
jgi:hypothetical protein